MKEIKKNKVLIDARSVFLRFGYRRVSMSDIAEAAGISRAALYLTFKNKEDVFAGVFLQWVDEAVAEIKTVMAAAVPPQEKLEAAFDIWAVRPFELVITSPEAEDLIECSLAFAQTALRQGYARFEATIAPVLAAVSVTRLTMAHIAPERMAHMLASAVRGFKQTATTAAELRELIRELLTVSLGAVTPLIEAAGPGRAAAVRRR